MSEFSVTKPLKFHERALSLTERFLRINWIYLLIISLIAGVGFVGLYSVAGGNFEPWAIKQMLRFVVGVAILVMVAMTNLKFWMKYAYIIYAAVLVLLMVVDLFGFVGMGAQRWINLGFIQIQPSELMKIAVVLALARYFHGKTLKDVEEIKTLFAPLLIVGLPVLLVIKQPDLGTAVMLTISAGVIFFVVGVQRWKFFTVIGIGLAALPILWNFFLHDYQKQRVLTFLNPEKDPLGAGYHILQSYITLGSGSLTGKGFLQGTQSQLNFLPEKHTDFIFTVLAEEFGLMGELILLLLYIALIFIGFLIALRCTSYFGKLIAIGLTSNLFFYIFINIAMVTGLVPVVGIPLPLVSYGGTALMTHMLAFGLIECTWVNKDVAIGRTGLLDED